MPCASSGKPNRNPQLATKADSFSEGWLAGWLSLAVDGGCDVGEPPGEELIAICAQGEVRPAPERILLHLYVHVCSMQRRRRRAASARASSSLHRNARIVGA